LRLVQARDEWELSGGALNRSTLKTKVIAGVEFADSVEKTAE